MRIEGPNRSNAVPGRSTVSKVGGGAVFTPAGHGDVARAQQAAPVSPTMEVGSILALQGLGDFTESRRRAVQRGKTLLNHLEQMKSDLILGNVSVARLDAMCQQLSEFRERVDPELDAVIDDIELRVLVELAKNGRFPSI